MDDRLDFTLSFEQLKAKYAYALREFDERPPEFVPRRKLTAAGVALLCHQAIDDLDTIERMAREAREAERRAARDLRERQRQHPLYHTHHRADLLKAWKERGEPHIPPKALQGFTDWVMRHADALEDDIRQHAETLSRIPMADLTERLGTYADRFAGKAPIERTERNIRRALRAAFRRFNEQAAHILHLVGYHGQKYVSHENRKARRHQLHQQQRWIEASTVEGPHLPKPIPLSACIRTVEARAAELYALSKGLETYMATQGRVALFVTLTAPAHYHPNPANGQSTWDGSSVTDSHIWFTQQWARLRTDLKNNGIRMDGMRVTEPHKDGAEHWHVLIYARPDDLDTIKASIARRFAHSPKAIRFEEVSCEPNNKKKASPASYMQKYILKALTLTAATDGHDTDGHDTDDTDTEAPDDGISSHRQDTGARAAATSGHDTAGAAAADAWRSTWSIRGFQFFGLLYGKQTLWRELRRLNQQPDDPAARRLWRAARGTRAHDFIAALDTDRPDLATIRETVPIWTDPDPATGETQPAGHRAGRILGVEINGQQYMTRPATACQITTDYAAMRDPYDMGYTVIPSGPRGAAESDHGPPRSPPDTVAA